MRRSKIKQFEWWIVFGLGLTAFFLALFGYEALFLQEKIERNLMDITYYSIRLFAGDLVEVSFSPLPWQLEIARWLSPAVFLYTAFKAVLYFIRREFRGQMLRFYKDHVIVVGLNEKSRYLVEDLLKRKRKVIVVAKVADPRKLDEIEQLGAIIEEGSFADPKFLRRIAVRRARYFVLLSEEDEANIARAITLYQYLNQRKSYAGANSGQVIHTHVGDDIKLNDLSELSFFEECIQGQKNHSNCEIRIFCMYERTARVLFNQYAPDVFVPIRPGSPQTSVAILGSGAMAQSMIVRLARLGHFANLKKLRVVLFHDGNAIIKKLTQNFPGIQSILELISVNQELEFFDMEQFNSLNQANPFSVVYMLCEDDSLSANLLEKLVHTEPSTRLNVVLGLQNPKGILSNWYNAELVENINLLKFNLIAETFSEESLTFEHLDELAQTIHAVYLAGLEERDAGGKATHRDWKFLPISARGQNRDQADHLFIKLRALDCEVVKGKTGTRFHTLLKESEMMEVLAEMEHNRWWANKLLSGWVAGEKEEGKSKRHPDMVPYDQLSESIKDWDRKAVENVPNLLAKGGFAIRRRSS